nr:unnamed protein product [Callosobruchus chinensis]
MFDTGYIDDVSYISEDLPFLLCLAHKNGLSGNIIAKNLNIPQGTIRSIISRFKENGNVQITPKPGRSSKVTKRDKRVLRALIKQDRRAPSRELVIKWADAIGKHVSKDTCLRNLKKMGYGFHKVGT